MKKNIRYIGLILLVVQILSFACPVLAARDDMAIVPKSYKLILCENSLVGIKNGEMSKLTAYPIKKNESLQIPVRYLFEGLGYTVEYADGSYAIKGEKEIILNENSNEAVIDGVKQNLKENVEIINNSLYVTNDICDFLGLKYTYSQNGLFVIYDGSYSGTRENDIIRLMGIYVDANAKSGDGSPSRPVKNLEEAKEVAIKRAQAFGTEYPVYIFIKGGVYKFDETVTFPPATFGKEDFKGVSISSYDGEAVFTGATELDEEDLKVVTDPMILARLPKAGRGEVAYLDLGTQGVNSLSVANKAFPEVFVNDDRQIQSRWPNGGFSTVKSVPTKGEFQFSDVNCKRWTTAENLYVNGFFQNDYFYNTAKVTKVDSEAMIITAGISSNRPGARWYARNLLEEIDVPGEWYVDRTNNILYFYPPYTLKDAKLEICTFMDKPMVTVSNTRNISFEGITFEKSGSNAISATGINGFTVEKCKFLSLQDYAIKSTGYDITINGNYAYDLSSGMFHGTTGSLSTLKSGNLRFTNNRAVACGWGLSNGNSICHGGYNTPEMNASVGAVIENNVVQDCNTIYAFSYPGVNTKIRNNEIINQSRNIHDGGSIYLGRSTSYIGNEIAYNYIHHLNRESFFAGLYNDDGYAWSNWHHNVLYNMNRPTIIGLGMGMEYKYNVAIDTVVSGTVGSRMNWGAYMYGPDGQMINGVKKALGWTDKYAELEPRLVESISRTPYAAPWDAVIFGNVAIGAGVTAGTANELAKYGAKTIMRDGKEYNIEGKNSTVEGNPKYDYDAAIFEDPDTQNWNIKPDSQVAKDFPELLEIDMEKIGLTEEGEHLKKINETFKLRYPLNGQAGVQTKEIRFSWDQLPGASKYRIVVATDPKLENVVFEDEIFENGVNNFYATSDLALDTVYYWKVYGISLARQDQKTVESTGVPYAFKTAKKNELSKENAKLAIDSLKAFSAGITEEYEYEEGFLNDMKALIERADKVYKETIEQDELDTLEEDIYNFIRTSPFFMTVEFKSPSFFSATAEDWKSGDGKITYEGDTIVLSGAEGKGANAETKIDSPNSVLCFQVKIDDVGENAGHYTGIYYKRNVSGGGSYLVCVKHDIYEFQKSGDGKFLIELPNHAVKSGEWFDVELGGINMPNGTLEFARINGQLIFAELDQTPTQIREGGSFYLHKNPKGNVSLRPAKNIPEKGSLVDSIYESFNNPQNEKGLAAALIGAYQVLEMDNPLYSLVEKQPLADRIYPIIKSGEMKIENRDITSYKAKLWENVILEGYAQGKADGLFVNNVKLRYNDVTQFDKIDKPGIKLYEYFSTRVKDIDRNHINTATMNGTYNNLEELRLAFARAVFENCLNICGPTFAADTSYMFDLLTKETADYIGINIDRYLKLSKEGKISVHEYIGRNGASERTIEEFVAEINEAAAKTR